MFSRDYEVRKRDHIRHALDAENQAAGLSGLEEVHLYHEALPDLDFDDITLTSKFLGLDSSTPFFVAAITAGHPDAEPINRALAQACAIRGWLFGLGSQRKELEALERGEESSFSFLQELVAEAPGLNLLANIGITQAIVRPVKLLRKLVELSHAKALVIHTNPLQEALQPEGTPKFKGALAGIKRICAEVGLPVILKETGCGFSAATLARLKDCDLAAIDISGLGGTHWGRIEGARAREDEQSRMRAKAAETFSEWGESTRESVQNAKKALSDVELWASGGVRSGLDAAKLIALGAVRVGYAQPALEAALKGVDAVESWMERQEFELRTALFCAGARSPSELRAKQGAWQIGV